MNPACGREQWGMRGRNTHIVIYVHRPTLEYFFFPLFFSSVLIYKSVYDDVHYRYNNNTIYICMMFFTVFFFSPAENFQRAREGGGGGGTVLSVGVSETSI